MSEIKIQAGTTVNVGAVLGTVGAGTVNVAKKEPVKAPEPVKLKITEVPTIKKEILSPAVKE